MRPTRVLETCVYTEDLDAAEQFYTKVLDLEVIARVAGRQVFFRCGHGVFLVFNPAETSKPGGQLPPHGPTGAMHMAFAVAASELSAWRAKLEDSGVTIEAEVSWPRGGQSLYFRDPAGNSIELATPSIWGIPE